MNAGWAEFAHCIYLRLRHLRSATNIQRLRKVKFGYAKKPFPNFGVSNAKNKSYLLECHRMYWFQKCTYQQFDGGQSHNDHTFHQALTDVN